MGMANDSVADLAAWAGKRESAGDVIGPAPLDRLAATLGRDDPPARPGDAAPPGWHWLYFLPKTPRADLGADGHAARGGFMPPVDLPRRMWAGGRMTFRGPLRVGEQAKRDSEILTVTPKEGRSGRLVFVTVRHVIGGEGGPAVEEEHDIVYRDAPRPGEAAPPAQRPPREPVWRRAIDPDPVLLFRFSALIFNAHRIHYDRDYAKSEGYPGLVVHGPLTAVLLLDLLRRECPDRALVRFDYRALAPLFETAPVTVAGAPDDDGRTVSLWAETPEGAVAMSATATLAA